MRPLSFPHRPITGFGKTRHVENTPFRIFTVSQKTRHGVAICYVFPVLWITFRLLVQWPGIGDAKRCTQSDSPGATLNRGRNLLSTISSLSRSRRNLCVILAEVCIAIADKTHDTYNIIPTDAGLHTSTVACAAKSNINMA